MFYVLRYAAGTDLRDSKHEHTLGRFETWSDAEAARTLRPTPWRDLLEVRGPRSDR